MPGVGSSKRREAVTLLFRLREAVLRFGQNAVRTPGRTHVNDCVTKGLKLRAALFKGLGIAHVGHSPVRVRSPGAKPLVAPRRRGIP